MDIYSWKRTGPHIRVVADKPSWSDEMRDHIRISIYNDGRSARTVQEIGIAQEVPTGGYAWNPNSWKLHPASDKLPRMLEPGAEISAYILYEDVAKHYRDEDMRPYAKLAGGKMAWAKKVWGLGLEPKIYG